MTKLKNGSNMKYIRPIPSTLYLIMLSTFIMLSIIPPMVSCCHAMADTIIVSAEGLADPDADTFKLDKAALNITLLNDAKKQAVEKVVGIYMEHQLLVKNYSSIDNKILAENQTFIKKILQKSEPWLGGDGFMHILIKAEVYATKVEDAIREMGNKKRVELIRRAGNPRISIAITIRDSKRDSLTKPEKSPLAENILKEHISAFGYRVWSEETTGGYEQSQEASDFAIRGEVKLKPINLKLKTSGIEINKLTITSWTVKCLNSATGEEIYFNNKIPARRSWNTEDEALAAIGKIIGEEFSREFFEQQLLQKTSLYQLEVRGLPDYDVADLLKKELIGLRPVLNVNLRSFDNTAGALYEVEFSDNDLDFSEILNNALLKPLNKKFGNQVFNLSSVKNLLIQVDFKSNDRPAKVIAQFEEKPPSSLVTAPPVRLNQIAATRGVLEKIEKINPKGVETVMEHRRTGGKTSLETIQNF